MSIARLLAVIDGGAGSDSTLDIALALGQAHAAHVELLHVMIDPNETLPILGEGASGIMVERVLEGLRASAEKRAARTRALYQAECVDAKLPILADDAVPVARSFSVALRELTGREVDEVARHGRLIDLIVVASPASDPASNGDSGSDLSLEAALFETGRPVLMAPATLPPTLGQACAVAWDETPEAARAAGAALPLLAKARDVYLLSAGDSEARTKPSRLAGYLAHHGIAAKTWAFSPGGGALGEELLEQADKAGADLLVMGAYGHSRLREMVIGGVTRSIIAKARIPVFLVH